MSRRTAPRLHRSIVDSGVSQRQLMFWSAALLVFVLLLWLLSEILLPFIAGLAIAYCLRLSPTALSASASIGWRRRC